jgi:Tfp pilus assembly protein PilX
MKARPQSTQRGLTMFFTMMLLLVLVVFAAGAATMLSSNLRITSNLGSQAAVEGAAQQALETVISNLGNFITPPAVPTTLNISNGTASKFAVTVQGPRCIAELPASGYSLTYGLTPKITQWEMQANARDTTLGGTAEIHQGVSIMLPAGSCR